MPENAGRLSPITSSSSQHEEETDNFVEYYVKANKVEAEYVTPDENVHRGENKICGNCKFYLPQEDACSVVAGGIEREAYCKLYVEGGEKMTEKGLDVDESITTDNAYEADTNTTEPDPKSELAMQKSFSADSWKETKESIKEFAKAAAVGGPTYTKPAELDGVGTYSTTANSTVDAPEPGATTEPETVHKAAGCSCDCEHCQKCAGMMAKDSHCDCCDSCGANCSGDCCDKCSAVSKVAKPESEETEADEPDSDEDDLEKKEFPTSRRKQLAREGKAMPDGSYPIESEQDLKNAIRSWGRGGADPKVKQHIIRRAKALGKQDLIPENWRGDVKKSLWSNMFLPVD